MISASHPDELAAIGPPRTALVLPCAAAESGQLATLWRRESLLFCLGDHGTRPGDATAFADNVNVVHSMRELHATKQTFGFVVYSARYFHAQSDVVASLRRLRSRLKPGATVIIMCNGATAMSGAADMREMTRLIGANDAAPFLSQALPPSN